MDPRRLPLWHVLRQKHRDDRLWVREKGRALLYNLDKMHCPYTKYKRGTMWTLQNVKIHQLQNGDTVTPTLTLFHIYMHATSNCTQDCVNTCDNFLLKLPPI